MILDSFVGKKRPGTGIFVVSFLIQVISLNLATLRNISQKLFSYLHMTKRKLSIVHKDFKCFDAKRMR